MVKRLHKEYCEIESCNETNPHVLEHHHIVERTELGTSNSHWNIAVICGNCHAKCHAGLIRIIGVFPSTNRHGRTLVYELNGVVNVPGITEAYFKHQPSQMRVPSIKEENE